MPLPASKSCVCRVLEVCFTFLLQVYAVVFFIYCPVLILLLNLMFSSDTLSVRNSSNFYFLTDIFFQVPFYFVSAVSNFLLSLSSFMSESHVLSFLFLKIRNFVVSAKKYWLFCDAHLARSIHLWTVFCKTIHH